MRDYYYEKLGRQMLDILTQPDLSDFDRRLAARQIAFDLIQYGVAIAGEQLLPKKSKKCAYVVVPDLDAWPEFRRNCR